MRSWKPTVGRSLPSVCVVGVIVSAVLALLVVSPTFAAEVVVHVAPTGDDAADGSPEKPATIFCDTIGGMGFGAREIITALGTATEIRPAAEAASSNEEVQIIIAVRNDSAVVNALTAAGESLPSGQTPESYSLRVTQSGAVTRYWAVGVDTVGAMYGALDIAEAITLGGLAGLSAADHQPFIPRRGIKHNIPLDSRTPSYSDGAENAWGSIESMWDFDFWREYLDNLARWRYNTISLWTLMPFPVMVRVPEYPNIGLDDVMMAPIDLFTGASTGTGLFPSEVENNLQVVKQMTLDEKIAFWQQVMQYGHDRGIHWYIFNWHVFDYGINGAYGISDDVSNSTTKDYYTKAVREMLLTYPHLAGWGITAAENMSRNRARNAGWVYDVYAGGVEAAKSDPSWQPGRSVTIVHRSQWTSANAIWNEFHAYPDSFFFEYKYANAHMFASAAPTAALGYYAGLPSGQRAWQTVRNDDFYMTRWGDAEFAREFIVNMNRPEAKNAGYTIGSSGFVWGADILSTEPETPLKPALSKHWYNYMLFGRLGYDPEIPNATFRAVIADRFPQTAGSGFFDGWASVSKIIGTVNRFHWYINDYMFFPEGCVSENGFRTVNDFINGPIMPGAHYMDIREYADKVRNGEVMDKTTPIEVAQELRDYSEEGLRQIEGINPGGNNELRLTLGDIRSLAYLGLYYSEKILGGTYMELGEGNAAVDHLKLAAAHWRKYASSIAAQYKPWAAVRLRTVIDPKAYWAKTLEDITLAGGSAEAASAQPTAGGQLLEAEEATITGGAIGSSGSGFTGTGYASITSESGGTVSWSYEAPSAGYYMVEFRYAMQAGDVDAQLAVNGTVVDGTLSFWGTGSNSIWQAETRYVELNAGANTITLSVAGEVQAIDHVNLVH